MPGMTRSREAAIRLSSERIHVRAAGDGEPAKLTGYFAVFNQPTRIDSWREGGPFMETVAPGAFKKTIRENGENIKLLLEHGSDPRVGQRPLGRITSIEEDEYGARYEAELYDTEYVNELLPALRDGQYGASFRFKAMRTDTNDRPEPSATNPDGIPERTLREVQVAEFGPVLWGAYPAASSAARSLTDEFLFRDFMDMPKRRVDELATYWADRASDLTTRAQPDGPCAECASYIDDANANDAPLPPCDACDRAAERAGVPDNAIEQRDATRDAEDVGRLAQALALVAQYIEEDADEPEDIAAAQAIAQQLSDLIATEVTEPEDDQDTEMNSSAPEASPRAARSTPTTPAIRATSNRAPYHLSTRKESSWKLTSP